MNLNIAVFAGAVAAAALGIGFTIQPEPASAPQESRPIEQSAPAPEFRSHLPELSPSAEPNGNVHEYH